VRASGERHAAGAVSTMLGVRVVGAERGTSGRAMVGARTPRAVDDVWRRDMAL
jgi:hypothetical protein